MGYLKSKRVKRSATAVWRGTGREGSGSLTTESHALNKTRYSYTSRFEQGQGTNPEELLAAAHAGCFTMKLAFNLQLDGYYPVLLETHGAIVLEEGDIKSSILTLNAVVEGISEKKFEQLVTDAKKNCPVSKLFHTQITVSFKLNA